MTKRYLALLSKDADSVFGIHFPDLPGCVATGETKDEALSNAAVAFRLWSDGGIDLPAPTTLSDLARQADVKADLARGSVVIAVDLSG